MPFTLTEQDVDSFAAMKMFYRTSYHNERSSRTAFVRITTRQRQRWTRNQSGLFTTSARPSSAIDDPFCSLKTRPGRKRQQSSGALPSFYTGVFETDDGGLAHVNYQLPYDIYWFDQKRTNVIHPSPPSLRSVAASSKVRSKQRIGKQPWLYEKILDNVYTEPTLRDSLLLAQATALDDGRSTTRFSLQGRITHSF